MNLWWENEKLGVGRGESTGQFPGREKMRFLGSGGGCLYQENSCLLGGVCEIIVPQQGGVNSLGERFTCKD